MGLDLRRRIGSGRTMPHGAKDTCEPPILDLLETSEPRIARPMVLQSCFIVGRLLMFQCSIQSVNASEGSGSARETLHRSNSTVKPELRQTHDLMTVACCASQNRIQSDQYSHVGNPWDQQEKHQTGLNYRLEVNNHCKRDACVHGFPESARFRQDTSHQTGTRTCNAPADAANGPMQRIFEDKQQASPYLRVRTVQRLSSGTG